VAGTLRYFADRFGVPRAAIEGTTLSYDQVRQYAVAGPPRVVFGGPRKHQRLAVERRRSYFGFDLETGIEPIDGEIPAQLQPSAREVLAEAVISGEAVHPDLSRLRRALATLDELWRRSGGTIPEVSPEALRQRILRQLDGVRSWSDFQRARIAVDPDALVDGETRARLEALPASVHLKGDAAPLHYEVENGRGVVRVRLREGQARRLRPGELPSLDRPIRFAVQRGRHAPLLADSIPDLQAGLRQAPRPAPEDDGGRPHRRQRGGGRRHRRR
jgi:hypothetical protein